MTPRETGLAILSELGTGPFVVYWVLESHANKEGLCWPSYDTLALQANISRRQVIRHIEALEQAGRISITRRGKATGGRDSNVYSLNRDLVTPVHSTSVKSALNLVTPVHHPSDTSTLEVVPTEPVKKKEKKHKEADLDGFAEWYDKYPRKKDRQAAERAWANLSKAKRQAALAGLDTYQFSNDPTYILYPATWLNRERWLDAPDPVAKPAPVKIPGQRAWSREEELAARSGYALLNMGGDE